MNLKIDQQIHNLKSREKNILKKNEDILRNAWANIKHSKTYIIGAPEEEERKTGAEKST